LSNYLEINKCDVCGNIVETVHAGGGTLACCGETMRLLTENTVDASREKHLPVVEKRGNDVIVTVGSIAHPMEENHYIEWIEVIADGAVYRKQLQPGQRPEAAFVIPAATEITAREYCTLHGQWAAKG